MPRKHNIYTKGKFPIYIGQFADGTTKALSFPTCAKKFAKDGTIEFENGRRLVDQVRNPPLLGNAWRGTRPNTETVPLVAGWVRINDHETIPDPMTETAKPKRTSAATLKRLIGELADALETRANDIDELLARAREVTA